MEQALAAFFAGRTPFAEEEALWGKGGSIPLHVAAYASPSLPPLAFVSSVRAVVFRGDAVLLLQLPGELSILPGGRREPGEALEQTVRREVREETGWEVRLGPVLGCIHFHHLGPRLPAYRFPYPDFLHIVYLAEALSYDAAALLPNEYEQEPFILREVAQVRDLPLLPIARGFLEAAVAARPSVG